MTPDPRRWPSSLSGNGFSKVADKVHEMDLKFGIHVMRGISTQAFNANTPILDITTGRAYEEDGKVWYARDIGMKERSCGWMKNGFMSVNTELGAGRAFLKSLYHQYAEWGVDFVKHDCVFGDDLDINEITVVSKVLEELDRPILYSLSPGTSSTPDVAKEVAPLVNMYRVTGDDWDNWGDVAFHFNVSRDFASANLIGSKGLFGNSWPDLDMLPLGRLTDPGSNQGPHRMSNLNPDEQRTQMTLWAMAKSPLMFGGDMRKLDDATYDLITNPTILEINSFSSNNKEFPYITTHKLLNQTRSLKGMGASKKLSLRLTSCKDPEAKNCFQKLLIQFLSKFVGEDIQETNNHFAYTRKNPFLYLMTRPCTLSDIEEKFIYKQQIGKDSALMLLQNESLLQRNLEQDHFHLASRMPTSCGS